MNDLIMWDVLFNEAITTVVNIEDVTFNWYWLYNSNIIFLWITRNYSSIEFNTFQNPQQDWNWFISSFNRWLNFSCNFAIKWNDQNTVDTLYDEMLTKLSYKQWIFKYKPSWWVYREIVATMNWITTNERTCKYITWVINFISIEPYWKNSINNSLLQSWIILSPFNIQVDNLWVNSLSKIYIVFWSWNSWVSSISVSWNNNNIWFSWSISDWDILVIDNENKEVLLNNILQDYTWTFLELINWVNSLLFTINWIINVDISINYPTNFLMP